MTGSGKRGMTRKLSVTGFVDVLTAEAQAAYEKAKRSEQSPTGGMPGGFPGGGMPGGMHGDFLGTAKRLLCSTASAEYISEVLDDDNISSSQVPATPLDSDDLLEMIILHLPLQPSSLPRASLVCKRWHSLLSDQNFTACYRKHHRKAPLLGFFAGFDETSLNFVPFPDTESNSIPIPTERFAVPESSRHSYFWSFLGCRHGLAVLLNESLRKVVVWDPLTGQQHRVSFPQELSNEIFDEDGEFILWQWHAAVLCADTEEGHIHGDCFSSPFKLVIIRSGQSEGYFSTLPTYACLYDSASGGWGDVVSTDARDLILTTSSSILTGNAFYWLFQRGDILVFDIERQSLGLIKKPACAPRPNHSNFQLLRTDNGSGLGLAVMSNSSIQLWERKSNYDGVVEWVLLQKNFQLERLYQKGMRSKLQEEYLVGYEADLVGYDEESNALVLAMDFGVFMLELDSMQFRTLSKSSRWGTKIHYPYRNFFTAGKGVGWRRAVLDL
ncbi:uncharacterized protein [Triticum aestivum]|uniref:uncharacterized protein isoform X1 n=1 Tax=Triticum aestivum TaxID=4565 RepID=UPI001D026703|nr:uncharacterized protein LOC123136662 isoform X1 [Triticum aestivum]